jgi:hypothetical protein
MFRAKVHNAAESGDSAQNIRLAVGVLAICFVTVPVSPGTFQISAIICVKNW